MPSIRGRGSLLQLNVLPKCTAISTYSYGLDGVHLLRLQQSFVKQAVKLKLYEGNIINLDFHTIPHFGEESVLEEHWAGRPKQKNERGTDPFCPGCRLQADPLYSRRHPTRGGR